jgi:hypothetical protein
MRFANQSQSHGNNHNDAGGSSFYMGAKVLCCAFAGSTQSSTRSMLREETLRDPLLTTNALKRAIVGA